MGEADRNDSLPLVRLSQARIERVDSVKDMSIVHCTGRHLANYLSTGSLSPAYPNLQAVAVVVFNSFDHLNFV